MFIKKMFLNKNFFIKSICLLFFLVFLFPIVDFYDLAIIVIFLLILFSTTSFINITKINFSIFAFLFLIIFQFYLKHYYVIEKNGIFIPNEHNESKYIKYDSEIFKLLKKKFNEKYSGYNIKCNDDNIHCWENTKLKSIFSQNFNLSSFYNQNLNIRKIYSINHNNLSSAKIGMINNLNLNWGDWTDNSYIKRSNAPYFMIYNFNSNIFKNSDLCWKGNAILLGETIKQINHTKYKCNKINKKFEILFYNFNSNLEVYLNKNITLKIFDIIDKVIKFLIIIFFINIFVKKFKINQFFILLSLIILSSMVIFYIFYSRDIFQYGYYPLDAGMDGLGHQGFANILSLHLLNLNFYEFLRGNENIYYFMPGLRYVLSIANFLFDFNFLFTFLLIIFFPVILYFVLLQLNLSLKFTLFITVFFILLKVPHLGFSFSHFARGALTIYPETYAVFCFFLFFLFFLKKYYFLSSILCFLMVFIRPNYFPILIVYLLFHIYLYFKNHELNVLIKTILGLSVFFLIPFHNYFYGEGSLVLFTNSAYISSNLKVNLYDYLFIFFDFEARSKIFTHLTNWITTGEKNNLFAYFLNPLLFINLFIYLIFRSKNKNLLLFFLISLSAHIPLFFYSNTGRYSYFPWLLVCLSNLIIIKEYYFIFFSKKNNKI